MDVKDWKKKYEVSERHLQSLKKLAHEAVTDYEDLRRKYDQNQKQYEDLKIRLAEREEEINKLRNLVEPAVLQYQQLHNRYEIERACRTEAEVYASKITKKNNILKRQSQMLLDKIGTVDISIEEIGKITDLDDNDNQNVESQVEHMNNQIEELQSKVASLQVQLAATTEERNEALEEKNKLQQMFDVEKEAHQRTQTSAQQLDASMKQFKRVSMLAYEEFGQLQAQLEEEMVLKNEAENFAAKMYSDKTAIQRESSVLLASAQSDARLTGALHQIEELSRELEDKNLEYRRLEKQLKDLEENHLSTEEVGRYSELESKLQVALEQVDSQQRQIKDMDAWTKKLQKENEEMSAELEDARERLKPPPPPPPPPLPPPTIFAKIFKTKAVKSKVPNVDDDPQKQAYASAIDEMMKRIKSGATLRPVVKVRAGILRQESAPAELPSSPPLTPTGSSMPALKPTTSSQQAPSSSVVKSGGTSAMQEMHKILTKVKKSNFDQSIAMQSGEEDSDLSKTFQKVRGIKHLSSIQEEGEEKSDARRTSNPKADRTSS